MPRSQKAQTQITIPQVKPETWQQLLEVSSCFGTLAPWRWMYDSDLVGLYEPRTKAPLICSVLGRLGKVLALLVYRGTAGRRWILNTAMNSGESGGLEDHETAVEQDCLKLEFVWKRELVSEDRAVLQQAKFPASTMKGRVWPIFRSMVPAGVPWHVTQAEAELLLYAVPRVLASALLLRDTPGFDIDLCSRGVPFLPADFDPSATALRIEDLQWEPPIAPPEPPARQATLSDESTARLSALPVADGFHLEVDIFYSKITFADKNRPWIPKVAMAVDRASTFLAGYQLAAADDSDAAHAASFVLENSLTQLQHRPESIHTQRPRVTQVISSLATKLGIPLVQESELAILNSTRREFEELVKRSRPR